MSVVDQQHIWLSMVGVWVFIGGYGYGRDYFGLGATTVELRSLLGWALPVAFSKL
jgi:hypothetical protein